MPTTSPTSLTELLQTVVTCRLADTYHMLPGIVKAYYPATEEADVQIAVNDPRFDPDTDVVATEAWPVYPHVRVAWPSFGGFVIRGPISVGDKVEVHFQDLDDSQFRTTGQQSDPARTRRFGSDSAYCIPWNLTDGGAAAEAGLPGLTLGKAGAQNQIRIAGSTIQLGATGGDFVALASKVATELHNISLTLASGTCAAAPGPVVFSVPYVPGAVASAVVAAQ